jgi:hypothetical protein
MPDTSFLILREVDHSVVQHFLIVSDESQELITRTTQDTSHTLTTRGLTLAALVIMIYLSGLAVPTDPTEALKSIVKP